MCERFYAALRPRARRGKLAALMAMPSDIGTIDLMLGVRLREYGKDYEFLLGAAGDKESKEGMKFLAEYMFEGVAHDWGKSGDPVEVTLKEMDRWGIEKAMIVVHGEDARRALRDHPT